VRAWERKTKTPGDETNTVIVAIIAQKMDGGGTQRGGEKAFFESSIICSSYILEKISFQRRHIHWLAIPWLCVCVRACVCVRETGTRER